MAHPTLTTDRRFTRLFVIGAAMLGILSPSVFGDVVKLKEAGEVRGVVKTPTARSNKAAKPDPEENTAVVIETLTGAEIELSPDAVAFITKRPRVLEEYDSLARRVADTVDTHWQLAEWCRQHSLIEPRKEQLEQILRLDPEHKQARYGLGHRRQGNRWIDPHEEDAELLAAGYVRYKGRVITTLERDQLEAGAARQQQQNEWRPKIRLWLGWLNARDPRRQSEAIVQFRELRDPDAIPAIADNLLSETSSVEVRRLAVQVIAQIGGPGSLLPLGRVALTDADYVLQDLAFEAIASELRPKAEPLFLKALKNESNAVVRRAAVLLGRLGSRTSIPALIEALNTSHKVQVAVQQTRSSFNRDGTTGGNRLLTPELEAALRTGQLPYGIQIRDAGPTPSVKWVTVTRSVQNPEVLEALHKLAQQDFSFDERAWRLWWQSQSK